MLLDVRSVAQHFGAVALTFALLLAVKFAVIYGLSRAFGSEQATSLRTALPLAPAGEFAFVLLSLAGSTRAIDGETLQIVLAATLLSMLLTPLIIARMVRFEFGARQAELQVCDTGSAVPESMAPLIFREPVERGGGLGIGLYHLGRLAQGAGYRTCLTRNAEGDVCFSLLRREDEAVAASAGQG